MPEERTPIQNHQNFIQQIGKISAYIVVPDVGIATFWNIYPMGIITEGARYTIFLSQDIENMSQFLSNTFPIRENCSSHVIAYFCCIFSRICSHLNTGFAAVDSFKI